MDSDSFYPAVITAARIIGLGEVVVKKIQALGIRLNEEEPKPPFPYEANLNKIEWFNKAQGKVRQLIQGLNLGSHHFLEMTVAGNWGNSLLSIQSTDVEPEGEQASVGFGVVDRITKAVNFGTIFDSEKKSSFLKIGDGTTPKDSRIGYGGVIAKFSGSTSTAPVTVTHNLGQVPTVFVGNADLGVPSSIFVTSQSATQTTFQVVVANALTLETAVWWIAIR